MECFKGELSWMEHSIYHLNSHCFLLLELLPFFMATDLFLTQHRFFGIVFQCIFAKLILYNVLSPCWKLICLKLLFCNLPICILYLSLFVYFIVSLMRLEAFALGALQMSYYYYYYYQQIEIFSLLYKCKTFIIYLIKHPGRSLSFEGQTKAQNVQDIAEKQANSLSRKNNPKYTIWDRFKLNIGHKN